MNEIADIRIDPIKFALDESMKIHKNDKEKIIYESLKRSKAVWENGVIHNLQIYGMNYQEFCNQFIEKKNLVFMNDKELNAFNKMKEIFEKIEEIERIVDE